MKISLGMIITGVLLFVAGLFVRRVSGELIAMLGLFVGGGGFVWGIYTLSQHIRPFK